MAVDTSRQRLEKLYQKSGDRQLSGATWAGFVTREPNRVIVQSKRRRGGFLNVIVGIGAIGLFGLYPAIGSLSQGLGGAPGWNDPWSCSGLRYRYETAQRVAGAPGFGDAYDGFRTAASSCEQYAAALPSLARAESCQSAIRTYTRLLARSDDRAESIGVDDADLPWLVRVTRERTRATNAVIGDDPRRADERLAAAYLDSCDG